MRVGGLAVCRQRPPTAKGVLFLTLEDEAGSVNVVVPPAVAERERAALREYALVAIAGRVERRRGLVHVLAERALGIDLV